MMEYSINMDDLGVSPCMETSKSPLNGCFNGKNMEVPSDNLGGLLGKWANHV